MGTIRWPEVLKSDRVAGDSHLRLSRGGKRPGQPRRLSARGDASLAVCLAVWSDPNVKTTLDPALWLSLLSNPYQVYELPASPPTNYSSA